MKRVIGILLVLGGLLIAAPAVLAGGWATVVLDELPTDVQMGKPVTVGFMVLQHGVRPVHDFGEDFPVEPILTAIHRQSGQQITAVAAPTTELGHFEVEVTFPADGPWSWSITPQPFGRQELGVVTVEPTANRSLLEIIRAFFGAPSRAAPGASAAPVSDERSQVAMGEALFAAKSCAACHNHQLDGAPNLVVYNPDPAFLRVWLRDPSAVRPDTGMPNLHLSDTEIDALIAFIEVRSQ